MNLVGPFNDLAATSLPDPIRGYADCPALASWLANAPAGRLVTPREHNAIVASLAWAQLILSRPIASLPVFDGTPTPYVLMGRNLILGATAADYVPGDVTLPIARPAGAAALPGAGVQTVTIADADRRAAFELCRIALDGLALTPDKLVVVRAGTAPSGSIAALIAAGAVVACVGLAAHAAYSAYVEAEALKALAHTEEVRIQEQGVVRQVEVQATANTAQVAAQVNGRVQAQAQRLAYGAATGTLPEPGPAETDPLHTQPIVTSREPPPPSADNGLSLGAILGVAGLGVAGAGMAYVSAARWSDKRAVRSALLRASY
jgi:hypothetical protein